MIRSVLCSCNPQFLRGIDNVEITSTRINQRQFLIDWGIETEWSIITELIWYSWNSTYSCTTYLQCWHLCHCRQDGLAWLFRLSYYSCTPLDGLKQKRKSRQHVSTRYLEWVRVLFNWRFLYICILEPPLTDQLNVLILYLNLISLLQNGNILVAHWFWIHLWRFMH